MILGSPLCTFSCPGLRGVIWLSAALSSAWLYIPTWCCNSTKDALLKPKVQGSSRDTQSALKALAWVQQTYQHCPARLTGVPVLILYLWSAKLSCVGRQCSAGLRSRTATFAWYGVWRSQPCHAELAQHPWLSKYQTCINHWRTGRPQQSGNDFRMGQGTNTLDAALGITTVSPCDLGPNSNKGTLCFSIICQMEIVFIYPLGYGRTCLIFIGIEAFKWNAPKMQGVLTHFHKNRFKHIFLHQGKHWKSRTISTDTRFQ